MPLESNQIVNPSTLDGHREECDELLALGCWLTRLEGIQVANSVALTTPRCGQYTFFMAAFELCPEPPPRAKLKRIHLDGGSADIVWMPAAPPAASLLPGEAAEVRVVHLEMLQHFAPQGPRRSAAFM
eukprot:scaffold89642_cov31-Prasinocladus_malaysianus.AAC.1